MLGGHVAIRAIAGQLRREGRLKLFKCGDKGGTAILIGPLLLEGSIAFVVRIACSEEGWSGLAGDSRRAFRMDAGVDSPGTLASSR